MRQLKVMTLGLLIQSARRSRLFRMLSTWLNSPFLLRISALRRRMSLPPDPFTPLHTMPQSSSMSQERWMKVKGCIQKVAKKQTIEDTLMNIHKANTDAINACAHEDMILKKCTLLLEEFKTGIWDVETYWEELRKLEDGDHPEKWPCHYSPD
ncbi:hypothetical protein J3A83DRAFT_1646243 [Scleroderma citrinum]